MIVTATRIIRMAVAFSFYLLLVGQRNGGLWWRIV